MARTYYKKTITAGRLHKVIVYPIVQRGDNRETRRAKRAASREAQKRMNAVNSYQKLEMQLAANYDNGDLWITLTYDDAHLPTDEKSADLCVDRFLRAWRRARRKRGQELRCHWNTEHLHEHESFFENGRWHHHLCVNSTGEDFAEIRRLWTGGTEIEIRLLHFGGSDSYEKLARYLCKERSGKAVGKHTWHHTRNIRRPEVDGCRVEPDEPVQTPRGCEELERFSEGGPWGRSRGVKFLAPFDPSARPRARRKRRR
ncbi:MAG: hypothetical protein IKF99_06230 [Oscillospiraceae bacterium]|nr:hypothetical protein [Oscillospiraceae bacterium]